MRLPKVGNRHLERIRKMIGDEFVCLHTAGFHNGIANDDAAGLFVIYFVPKSMLVVSDIVLLDADCRRTDTN